MIVLIDTHVLIWWNEASDRLSPKAAEILGSLGNQILISAAVGWELAIKVSTGKMKPRSILDALSETLKQEVFSELPISLDAAVRAGLLPPHHRDPFDRMLIAQAQSLNLPILSADALFDRYEVQRLW